VSLISQLPCWAQYERLRLANALLEDLKAGNAEDSGLSRSRLRLRDDVSSPDDRSDSPLLDGRRSLEAKGVDTPQQRGLEIERVEGRGRRSVINGLGLGSGPAATATLVFLTIPPILPSLLLVRIPAALLTMLAAASALRHDAG